MLALAVVLLLVVAVLVIASFAGSSEELVIEFLNVTITTSVGGIFLTGVGCGLVALASALALRRSWRLRQARAEEVRELRRLAGVPDPGETEPITSGPGKTSPASAASADSGSARGEYGGTDDADKASADLAAPSGDTDDTAPVPEPEDPPRT